LLALACDPLAAHPSHAPADGDPRPVRSDSVPNTVGPAVALAAGNFHTCAALRDGSVRCWGMGKAGQLGDGTATQRDTPVRAGDLADVIDLVAEGDRTCAVRRSGDVWCWGHGASAEFGDHGPDDRTRPVHIPVWQHVRRLALAMDHDCAIVRDGRVLCRGTNTRGSLGDGTTDPRDVPVPARGLTNAASLGVGYAFSCAVQDGKILCWGWAEDGRCGDGEAADHLVPRILPDVPPARAITVGFDHACALFADGVVRCWGGNVFGQIGDGTVGTALRPTPVQHGALTIRAGGHQTTAVLADRTARGWGREGGDTPILWPACADPQVRQPIGRRNAVWVAGPAEPYCPHPTPISALSEVAAVTSSNLHACALLRGGQVWCWGSDAYGSLGDPATGDRDHPVQVDLR
jgi:alpha-tubulin suppressor-like RCC1 family protein